MVVVGEGVLLFVSAVFLLFLFFVFFCNDFLDKHEQEINLKTNQRRFPKLSSHIKFNRNFVHIVLSLTLSMLWAHSADGKLIFFLILPRKQDLTFHANCLLRRQFA